MIESRASLEETEATMKQWTMLQDECRLAMLRHVHAVGALMNADEGQRYIKLATTSLLTSGTDHQAAMAHAIH